MHKTPGRCSLCDKEVFDVLAKNPLVLGAPHEDAWRVLLVLTDGTQMPVTSCEGCLDKIEDALPELWKTVMRSFLHERSDGRNDDFLGNIAKEAPLGVLYREKYG